MNFLTHLECSRCGKEFDIDKVWNLCPECEKPLFARYDLKAVSRAVNPEIIFKRMPNLWRYSELLPVRSAKNRLSLGEGFTPLFKATNLGKILNFDNLFIKDESLNPTSSFKARGLGVAVSRARELGITALSIPSAGNAAGAMSAYAAKAKIPAFVFMPRDVPKPFIVECQLLGAQVTLVDGLISDAGKFAKRELIKHNRFDMSTLKEPYRLEGKKTMGYEIAEQLGWELPDVIIYPTGGGTGLIGMWKAFDEMEKLGWISNKRPRMVCVQSKGCAPIVRAFRNGSEFAQPWDNAQTIADGLRVPAAVGDFLILQALRESNGIAIDVCDKEILKSVEIIGHAEGLFLSPEAAAPLTAFQQLQESGWINDKDKVLLFATGGGLKYTHLWS